VGDWREHEERTGDVDTSDLEHVNDVARRTLTPLNLSVQPPDYLDAYVDHDGALWLLHSTTNEGVVMLAEDVPQLIAFLREFLTPTGSGK